MGARRNAFEFGHNFTQRKTMASYRVQNKPGRNTGVQRCTSLHYLHRIRYGGS